MKSTKYPLAERFFAPQGEGLYSGTPMAFIRFVGCSVGKKICTNCDTDFERMNPDLGGGLLELEEIAEWVSAGHYKHVCLTGGEPLDRNLLPLIYAINRAGVTTHIETSGTKNPKWMQELLLCKWWLCVSPKPGYLQEMIDAADEIKVILHGLGDGEGWPTLEDAVCWADEGKLVYLQPRNLKHEISYSAMKEAIAVVSAYPQLRLSAQLHKFWGTR